MRSYPEYCRGRLELVERPILVCKLHRSLDDNSTFETNIPLASAVKEWLQNYPELRVAYLYRESYEFELDKYINFSCSSSVEKITADSCIDIINGAPGWVLAKVFVEGYDRIALHYFNIARSGKVNQLLITLRQVPFIRLVIAETAINERAVQKYYEIAMHGMYDDAIAGLNAIYRLHHCQPISTVDLTHVSRISVINKDGKLAERQYIGLVGDNPENSKCKVLSLKTA